MIKVEDRSQCCGCTACSAICPHDAITMKADSLGFLYPFVDLEKCTDCGLCEKVCDFTGRHAADESGPDFVDALAVRNKNEDVLRSSQSGGVFTALSDCILSEKGVVYGAVLNEDFSVSHSRADTRDGRDRMRGSKYVQSDLSCIYRQVLDDLKNGLHVLFTGTPCQVAGLYSFLPASLLSNMVFVDFVCHGVPSPAVWKSYVQEMSKKGHLERVSFRDKDCGGWKDHKETFLYSSGKKKISETFKVLFYKNIMLRHSCAVCPYHSGNRRADITMADFWGVGDIIPEFDGDDGTSMVICHTAKGRELMAKAETVLDIRPVSLPYDFIMRRNPNLLKPSGIYKDRMKFEEAFARKGFSYVASRWGDRGWRYKVWQLKVLLRKMKVKL